MKNNGITKRPYSILSDFMRVYEFLGDNYTPTELNGNMMPQFFEYAHVHSYFNKNMTHHMTIWEDSGKIAAFCGYEMDIGEAYPVVGRGYEYLLPEILSQAERELSAEKDGRRSLEVWVTSSQSAHIALLRENGYEKAYTEPVKLFRYENGFPASALPDGFGCISLENDIDYRKLNRCIWRGFDHGDDVEYNTEEIRYMSAAPHFRPEIGRIITAPDGEYACYAGMWLDEKNGYAYLEPLCTQPQYRRMGLARYALCDAMKHTQRLGARYCFGGAMGFYDALGFTQAAQRQMWRKTL